MVTGKHWVAPNLVRFDEEEIEGQKDQNRQGGRLEDLEDKVKEGADSF